MKTWLPDDPDSPFPVRPRKLDEYNHMCQVGLYKFERMCREFRHECLVLTLTDIVFLDQKPQLPPNLPYLLQHNGEPAVMALNEDDAMLCVLQASRALTQLLELQFGSIDPAGEQELNVRRAQAAADANILGALPDMKDIGL